MSSHATLRTDSSMAFFQKVLNYVFNNLLVEGLANKCVILCVRMQMSLRVLGAPQI